MMSTYDILRRVRLSLAEAILPDKYQIVRDYTRSVSYVDLKPGEFKRLPKTRENYEIAADC